MRMQDARDMAIREGISVIAAKMRLIRADKRGKKKPTSNHVPDDDTLARLKYLYNRGKERDDATRVLKAQVVVLELQVKQIRNAMARRSGDAWMPADDDYTDGPFSE